MPELRLATPADVPALRRLIAASVRGLGRRLFERCAADAHAAGFRDLELMATLPGEPLYRALGFEPHERSVARLPDGQSLGIVRMTRPLADPVGPAEPEA
jgi:N-acetylglutamate synthase-like GNAT family acetyltransferase